MLLDLIVEGWLGIATGLAILVALRQWFNARSEAQDANYLRDRLTEAREDVRVAYKRRDFWKGEHDKLHTSFVQLDANLQEARSAIEVVRTEAEEENGFVDELGVALRFVLADLEAAEAEIEELEEESDDLEESVIEATEGWQASVNLMTRIIKWGEGVLDTIDRLAERRRL